MSCAQYSEHTSAPTSSVQLTNKRTATHWTFQKIPW